MGNTLHLITPGKKLLSMPLQ